MLTLVPKPRLQRFPSWSLGTRRVKGFEGRIHVCPRKSAHAYGFLFPSLFCGSLIAILRFNSSAFAPAAGISSSATGIRHPLPGIRHLTLAPWHLFPSLRHPASGIGGMRTNHWWNSDDTTASKVTFAERDRLSKKSSIGCRADGPVSPG